MIPEDAHICSYAPLDFLKHIQFYINIFDHSWIKYLTAVGLNIAWNLD